MSEKLKPCPFCGSEAEIEQSYDMYKVCCSIACCNKVPEFKKSEAIKEWNTRTQPTITVEDIAEILQSKLGYSPKMMLSGTKMTTNYRVAAQEIMKLIEGK